MMREDGFDIRIYDPFFHPDESVLKERYDFITCTETAEHFHHPAREFPRLIGMLRPGGLLAVMTGMLEDRSRFPGWHYHRDPTHVMFYSEITMRWIAQWLGLGTSFPAPNVTFFRRPV
jgi:2-polyprenyl-3-methyl-5-hydroxy-6-metoxy-1,4-benzoquinol methylase